jgi:cytochrome c-type biogenesis protein
MGGSVGLLAAFGAGVVSFLSPCILPLVPAYVSFISGVSLAAPGEGRAARRVLGPALLFVCGFSIVFIALGASASLLGSLLAGARETLSRVAGVFIFLLGFLMLGVVRVPWLYGEARFDMQKTRAFGSWTALPAGMAFAFGWTPCVGPILASILMLAGRTADVGQGVLLLATYSAGLAVPFLLVALLFGRLAAFEWLKRHSVWIGRVAGVLLMMLGLAIAFGQLGVIVSAVQRVLPAVGG